ncbi:hypothetical protein [Natronomonas sp. LN261]|nr:hypothetical protein [Natronomonas sp. LN261]
MRTDDTDGTGDIDGTGDADDVGRLGLRHPTVVPENFEPSGADAAPDEG